MRPEKWSGSCAASRIVRLYIPAAPVSVQGPDDMVTNQAVEITQDIRDNQPTEKALASGAV